MTHALKIRGCTFSLSETRSAPLLFFACVASDSPHAHSKFGLDGPSVKSIHPRRSSFPSHAVFQEADFLRRASRANRQRKARKGARNIHYGRTRRTAKPCLSSRYKGSTMSKDDVQRHEIDSVLLPSLLVVSRQRSSRVEARASSGHASRLGAKSATQRLFRTHPTTLHVRM